MKKILEFVVGLGVWVAIAYGVYFLFIKGEATSSINLDVALADYRNANQSTRDGLLAALIQASASEPSDQEHFKDCMGDYAASKSEELDLREVFNWCVAESQTSRERFTSHFNQLDAADLSIDASVICQNHVDNHLTSPSTADHPWMGIEIFDHGKWRYTIRSHVDSQNAFGAVLRTNYLCKVTYNGEGESLRLSNWSLDALEFYK